MTYWAIVPAAGIGARMGSGVPKQYLPLCGRTVIEHSLERLYTHAKIAGIIVAVAVQDKHWEELSKGIQSAGKPLLTVEGGAERIHSVLNALKRLATLIGAQDWVLVHDAIRPCIRHVAIDKLIDKLSEHPVGGLLGVQATDTMKRVDLSRNVVGTLDRDQLWHAQTPQMFRLGPLTQALTRAMALHLKVTDEAAAMDLTGARPAMVKGHTDNIKVTRPPDLALAQFYLEQQERGL